MYFRKYNKSCDLYNIKQQIKAVQGNCRPMELRKTNHTDVNMSTDVWLSIGPSVWLYGVHIAAVAVILYVNAEAVSHCSCCHCQAKTIKNLKPCSSQDEDMSVFNACVFTGSKCTEWNHQCRSLVGDSRALHGTFWDPPGQTNEARAVVDSPANDTRQGTKQSDRRAMSSVWWDSYDKKKN